MIYYTQTQTRYVGENIVFSAHFLTCGFQLSQWINNCSLLPCGKCPYCSGQSNHPETSPVSSMMQSKSPLSQSVGGGVFGFVTGKDDEDSSVYTEVSGDIVVVSRDGTDVEGVSVSGTETGVLLAVVETDVLVMLVETGLAVVVVGDVVVGTGVVVVNVESDLLAVDGIDVVVFLVTVVGTGVVVVVFGAAVDVGSFNEGVVSSAVVGINVLNVETTVVLLKVGGTKGRKARIMLVLPKTHSRFPISDCSIHYKIPYN